jgi:hypothetical protein
MASALHPGIENDPHHQAAVAQKDEEKRLRNAAMLTTGFWAGVIVGLAATAGLVATYFLK